MTSRAPTVAVVGGGPAGLMAAEILATAGIGVTVFELHRSMGRKLLLAGRSGLNLTHSEPLDVFLTRYAPSAPPLDLALREYDQKWLRAWADGLGETTFVGSSGRVFPASVRAAPLLRAWLGRLSGLGVEFRPRHRWMGWTTDGLLRFEVGADLTGVDVNADATVLALGGASWPRVGSDGSWAATLTASGVPVKPLRSSNCGVAVSWSAVFVDRFEGEPVKNVVVTASGPSRRGEIVVTRSGLEGGPVYAASAELRRGLARRGPDRGDPCELLLDLAPDLTVDRLVARLSSRRSGETQSRRLRRAGFSPVEIGLLRESTHNRLPDGPSELAELAKAVPIEVAALMPIERAISSAGGVSFSAVDDQLMVRDLPGTFVAGEMLDWDAPTGGYLLQACFASGAAAGAGARDWLRRDPDR
jgi:uncharacterized flavoprotein (TIGR03862 family)